MFRGMFKECVKIAFVIKRYGHIKLPRRKKNEIIPYDSSLSDRTIWRRMKKEVIRKEKRIIINSQKNLSDIPTSDFLLLKKAVIAAENECKKCNGPDDPNLYCGASKVMDRFNINF